MAATLTQKKKHKLSKLERQIRHGDQFQKDCVQIIKDGVDSKIVFVGVDSSRIVLR